MLQPTLAARRTICLVAVALLATLAAPVSIHGDDSELAGRLRAAGEILPLEFFVYKAQTIRPGTLLDARLHQEPRHHDYVYEIRMLDRQGQIWEVEFDAYTGVLIEHGAEDEIPCDYCW